MTTPSGARGRDLRVLGVAGSLRRRSFNRALLRAAVELAPDGMRIEIFERLGDIPLYNADLDIPELTPEPVRALRDAIRSADAVLFATPEYNYGVPGVLKNAFDWASRPAETSVLVDKAASIIGAATGFVGTARAQLALRQHCLFTRTLVQPRPEVLVARAADRFDTDLRLVHEETREVVRKHLLAFRDWIERVRR
jgi:chromate reductase